MRSVTADFFVAAPSAKDDDGRNARGSSVRWPAPSHQFPGRFLADGVADPRRAFVANGVAASGAFLPIASGDLTGINEVGKLWAQLFGYSERETLAMIEMHRVPARLPIATSRENPKILRVDNAKIVGDGRRKFVEPAR